jgi:hypothetical protein
MYDDDNINNKTIYVWTCTGDGVFVGGEDDGVHGAGAQQAQVCPGWRFVCILKIIRVFGAELLFSHPTCRPRKGNGFFRFFY